MVKKLLTILLSAALCAGVAFPAAACKNVSDSGNSQGSEQEIPGGNQGSSEQEKPGETQKPSDNKPAQKPEEKGTEGLYYEYDSESDSYIVEGINGEGINYYKNCTEIVIPASYNGKPVTAIGYQAFYGCISLTSITIPDSVTGIGSYAFDGTAYYNNKDNWENGVLYIGKYLIKAKDTLSGYYTIKDGTKTIARRAFEGCSSLTGITIPDDVTTIGYMAFYDCKNLQKVEIHDLVAWCKIEFDNYSVSTNPLSYAHHLFLNGQEITGLVIPDSVKSIGGGAFCGCSFKSIMIPDSVTAIGDEAFEGSSLTSITIPDSVTAIGDDAFRDCTSLTSVTIGNGVEKIEQWFSGCTSLASITIPDSVTSIERWVFSGTAYYNNDDNWEKEVLYIGNHLIKAKDTISGDYNIKSGTKTIANGAFNDCTSLTSISIPDSVTAIGDGAFSGCTSLTSITIPDSVTTIGDGAFV